MMAACEQGRGFLRPYLSDLGLCRIPCYMLLHRTEVLSLNCGLSAKYQHRLLTMKNNNISIGSEK